MLTRREMLGQVAVGGVWALGSGVAAAAIGGTATNFVIPRGACDCHVHVFGAAAQFPIAATRTYTPPSASVEQLLEPRLYGVLGRPGSKADGDEQDCGRGNRRDEDLRRHLITP